MLNSFVAGRFGKKINTSPSARNGRRSPMVARRIHGLRRGSAATMGATNSPGSSHPA
jgi:hypothetical protein